MRFVARTRWWFMLPLVAACGCAQQSPMFQSQVQSLQQQQTALAMRNTELQSRASALDKDNQELQTLLSQSQQQSRLFEDQLTALRDQLSSATTQNSNTIVPPNRKLSARVKPSRPSANHHCE